MIVLKLTSKQVDGIPLQPVFSMSKDYGIQGFSSTLPTLFLLKTETLGGQGDKGTAFFWLYPLINYLTTLYYNYGSVEFSWKKMYLFNVKSYVYGR